MPNEIAIEQSTTTACCNVGWARRVASHVLARTLLCMVFIPPLVGACGARAERSSSTDTDNPGFVDERRIRVQPRGSGSAVVGDPGAVPKGSRVTVRDGDDQPRSQTTAASDGSFELEVDGALDEDAVLEIKPTDGPLTKVSLDTLDDDAQGTIADASTGSDSDADPPPISLPAECGSVCAAPCSGCDGSCVYFGDAFSCCHGDQCNVIGCGGECSGAAFASVRVTGASELRSECVGECSFGLSFSADSPSVSLRASSTRIRPMRENHGVLSEEGQAALVEATSAVNAETLRRANSDQMLPPCETDDCVRVPHYSIRFDLDGASAGLSYEEAPAALAALVDVVDQIHSSLSTCEANVLFEPSAECTLGDPDAAEQRLQQAREFRRRVPECGKEMHIIALDGADYGGTFESTPHEVYVGVERKGSHVLVLSSYAAVHWRVFAMNPDVEIERVVLNGYYPQSAEVARVEDDTEVPLEVPTDSFTTSIPESDWKAYVNDWPVGTEGEDAFLLLIRAEQLTDRALTSYQTCAGGDASWVIDEDLFASTQCSSGDSVDALGAAANCESDPSSE